MLLSIIVDSTHDYTDATQFSNRGDVQVEAGILRESLPARWPIPGFSAVGTDTIVVFTAFYPAIGAPRPTFIPVAYAILFGEGNRVIGWGTRVGSGIVLR